MNHFLEYAMTVKGQNCQEAPPSEVCVLCGCFTEDTYYNEETDDIGYVCDTCAWSEAIEAAMTRRDKQRRNDDAI